MCMADKSIRILCEQQHRNSKRFHLDAYFNEHFEKDKKKIIIIKIVKKKCLNCHNVWLFSQYTILFYRKH